MSNGSDCRTAPATLGLLTTEEYTDVASFGILNPFLQYNVMFVCKEIVQKSIFFLGGIHNCCHFMKYHFKTFTQTSETTESSSQATLFQVLRKKCPSLFYCGANLQQEPKTLQKYQLNIIINNKGKTANCVITCGCVKIKEQGTIDMLYSLWPKQDSASAF